MGSQRRQTVAWEPWFIFSADRGKIACVFCDISITYKKDRAFAHYGFGNYTPKTLCSKIPPAVKERFRNCGGVIPQRMTLEEMGLGESLPPRQSRGTSVDASSQPIAQEEVQGGNQYHIVEDAEQVPAENDPPQGSGSLAASNSTRSGSMRQRRMEDAYNIAKRKELDEKWASFFYTANVPFNVARHPAFIEAVRATSVARFEYIPPTYHQIRTKYIAPKRLQVE